MKKLVLILSIAVLAGACSRNDALEIPAGSDVTVQQKDGVTVEGRLIEVKADQVIVESRDGVKTTIARAQIAELRSASLAPRDEAKPAPAAPVATAATTGDAAAEEAPRSEPGPSAPTVEREAEADADPAPRYREVTLPSGTLLPLTLRTAVGSDTSNVEDRVRATLRSAVTRNGVSVLPAGTEVTGHVTNAQRSARVKGRASVAFRFTRVDLPDAGTTSIRTGTVARTAPGSKKRDAAKIGGGAVGGAIVGGILGGGDGAAKGAVIGGAGGTGVVLATRGQEVRMAAGTPVSVKLTAPLTVRVPVR